MCGIAGWIDWKEDLTKEKVVLEKMTNSLIPRGPDAAGYWYSHQAAFGHRRLIVVDPQGGSQPMVKEYQNRRYILTYNGELYNTNDLRQALQAEGHHFTSYSDTEVVLVAFIQWGAECVRHFNGIYAFGIWDEAGEEFFMARDRFGVKPLFYADRGSSLLFGSEIKALLAHPGMKRELDREGVAEVFGLGPARTPGHGVLRGIQELRPGFRGIYNRHGLRIDRYWALESKPHEDSFETTLAKVQDLLKDAIKRQLVADVPLCTFLSGGLDSSIITAVTAGEWRSQKNSWPLNSYSVDYLENERYFQANTFQPNRDSDWIPMISKEIGTKHHEVFIEPEDLFAALKKAVLARDLPGMADVDSSLFLFCEEVKKEATVALSGECADEIFGGYPWFHRPELLNAPTFPWAKSLAIRKRILNKKVQQTLDLTDYVQSRYQATINEVPLLPEEQPWEARMRELFYLNFNWFMMVLLERKDRMSMASGFEVRVPFCDHRIVEYLWNVPWKFKSYQGREKGLLRKAMEDLLPAAIIERKKSPYPKTYHPRYTEAVVQEVKRVLADPTAPINNLIERAEVERLLDSLRLNLPEDPWFGQLMTLPQLLAYLLQTNMWLKNYQINICL